MHVYFIFYMYMKIYIFTPDELPTKHWTSTAHLAELAERGCTVVHGVNVHDMHEHVALKRMTRFDRVIFNFPHAGHDPFYCERHAELIRRHKELLRAFFRSAKFMLSEGGEVHVSHRDDYPYCEWKLQEIAEKEGFQLHEKVEFKKVDYPGYHNKRGGGIRSNKTFPLKECFTFKFMLKECREKRVLQICSENGREDYELQITQRSGGEEDVTMVVPELAI
ncbi:Uncharacterized protein ACMD2_24429 [Ananas comosus]|uniref:25S rRNA (uridine-N(3))-methyltransferase BMT5-like domain-containing protein n=1 Tax=Ananas comosus TaxID=4615 RepID=A0A199VK78_ANACO|nr:Uncharacterized protein ACMD2_24429 [Ananas comosus]